MTDKVADVLIIGAGMAGLMAANILQGHRMQVRLLDKGRSVGGRLATRRIGPGRADHGAQFFTVRTPEFEIWVYRWLRDGLVFRWSTGWSNGSLDTEGKPDGYPRFAVNGGMNALTKHLATGLAVELNVKLVSVSGRRNRWLVIDETGKQYAGRALIMTPPVPQGLALLETGQTAISQEDQAALARIKYAPCVAGLFWVDGTVNLPEPGAIQRPGAPISWIADNQRKGISPEATLITVHAGQEYSRFLWKQPADEALQALIDGLSPFLEDHTKIIESQLKRWRYSLPISLHPERCLTVSQSPPLIFAGDAFGEARVEGAALSGMAAANKLVSILDHHSVYKGAK